MIKLLKSRVCNSKEQDLINEVGIEPGNAYMIYEDNTLVGCIEYRMVSDSHCHIDYIHTLKAYRGRGYGKSVINSLLDEGYYITGDSVIDSIGFWLKVGAEFEECVDDANIAMYTETNSCIPFIIE